MTIRRDEELSTWGKVKRWSGDHPRISRPIWFLLGCAVVAGIVYALTPDPRFGFRTAGPGGFGPGGRGMQQAQPVVVAVAERAPINVTVNALGTVTPLATATVRPQASGMLLKINFTEGQMVKAGDVLAEIDPRPYQAALAQAEATLASDQANLANQKTDLARYEELAKQNAISQQQLATSRAQVAATTARVQGDLANVQNARINLGYTRVVSPVTGRVGLHLVDVGNIVSNGQSGGLVVVTQLDPMSVLFTVPEDNVATINARMADGATLVVDAYDRSQTTKVASGTLATVDNVIDVSTGSVKLRALFDNKDGKLFPNQFVNVRLVVDTLQDQTVIPLPAVQRGSDGTYVFVVNPDKTVSTRTVKLGVQEGEKVAITEGLQPGDTVVIQGADRLRDGAEVTIPDVKTAIQQPSAGAGAGAAAGRSGRGRGLSPAAITRITTACVDDIKSLCSTPEQLNARGPGGGNRAGGGQRGPGGGFGGGQRGPGGGGFGAAQANPQMRVVTCLMRNREDLSRQCTSALPQRGQRGGGGGFGGGGGGFGGPR
jgi:multidrug efflux system membrane fusion protein